MRSAIIPILAALLLMFLYGYPLLKLMTFLERASLATPRRATLSDHDDLMGGVPRYSDAGPDAPFSEANEYLETYSDSIGTGE